ncbi:hypothetical protein BFJ63_vAg9025 [Fusarium oxysporum f. sp. narcissi]|uniref:Uncharacterized protein n=1 Tax=Fusarium oxysporum f. sp. narcissi TaxID=451672 RepID=A0A4V1S0C9_FUSOX|nr:hypothetical protein BFJ63_vAg9025 [Fusarium oxysporum f. sp. narcissi]
MIISPRLAILFLASTAKAQTDMPTSPRHPNAADLETLGTAFNFDFYATADDFSTSKPGDLLKFAAIDSSHLNDPAGMAFFRFQYSSRDLDGSPVPSTEFIAFPFAKPTQGRKLGLVLTVMSCSDLI